MGNLLLVCSLDEPHRTALHPEEVEAPRKDGHPSEHSHYDPLHLFLARPGLDLHTLDRALNSTNFDEGEFCIANPAIESQQRNQDIRGLLVDVCLGPRLPHLVHDVETKQSAL